MELRRLLAATRDEIEETRRAVDSESVTAVELVAMLESLAVLDQQRAVLLEVVRLEASNTRRREEERSIRQFVLRALDEISAPQTSGFLEDYVYARERVVTKTRGFSSLRRDENKAWRRRPDDRNAYIVPCLAEDGRAVPRWMSRSDWGLHERVLVPGVEELWHWKRVNALFDALYQEDDEHAEQLYVGLIVRYAQEAREDDDGNPGDGAEIGEVRTVDLEALQGEAAGHVTRLEAVLLPRKTEAAARLTVLPREQMLWGATATGVQERSEVGEPSAH